ncbi:hypothetical protein LTR62_005172 [Meristemomyces frigidus]|uniref:Rhodopsin domain-containing protein n=1 Tax=Meristemomyces frigidus TaxID=1508187 RepID=A0AAN7TQ23_9PEZI|nr:hypothetical protein LTR62_005172 [Meristemomyces frigidus]
MFREDAGHAASPSIDVEFAKFDGRDLGWQALGPTIALVLLSTCVVILRWYTRARMLRCTGWDDYVILLSLMLAWVMLAIIATAIDAGMGTVQETALEAATVTRLVVANNDVWAILVNVTKASILMQYLRVFSGKRTCVLCYILLAASLPVVLWAVLGGTLLCTPVAKLWNPDLPGHCLSAHKYWTSVAAIDIIMDFLVLCVPIPAVFNLHLPSKQKISLVIVFLLGFFVCGADIARLTSVLVTTADGDLVLAGVWAVIWSVVVANVGIICASLLALRPLLDLWLPGLMHDEQPPRHSMRLPTIDESEPVRPSVDTGTSQKHPETPSTQPSIDHSTHPHAAPAMVAPFTHAITRRRNTPVLSKLMIPAMQEEPPTPSPPSPDLTETPTSKSPYHSSPPESLFSRDPAKDPTSPFYNPHPRGTIEHLRYVVAGMRMKHLANTPLLTEPYSLRPSQPCPPEAVPAMTDQLLPKECRQSGTTRPQEAVGCYGYTRNHLKIPSTYSDAPLRPWFPASNLPTRSRPAAHFGSSAVNSGACYEPKMMGLIDAAVQPPSGGSGSGRKKEPETLDLLALLWDM